MGDLGVPRAEDGLAPDRRLISGAAVAAALAALAGCGGSGPYSAVTFHNDLGKRVTLGYCAHGDATCRQIRWRIAIDPGQRATQEVRSDGTATRRFLVVLPPERIFGCFVFRLDEPQATRTVELSEARGCGSGR